MTTEAMKLYRMKPNCVVGGVSWWNQAGSYYGHDIPAEVRTVRLWDARGSESVEVLR